MFAPAGESDLPFRSVLLDWRKCKIAYLPCLVLQLDQMPDILSVCFFVLAVATIDRFSSKPLLGSQLVFIYGSTSNEPPSLPSLFLSSDLITLFLPAN